jgi:hypothetical protein
MFNLLRRAASYAPLTAGERALLRLCEGLLCAGLVAMAPVVAHALAQQQMSWSDTVRAALAAGAVAVLLALSKYARAHGDPALTGPSPVIAAPSDGRSDSSDGVAA